MQSLKFSPFAFSCACGQTVVVKSDERCEPLRCLGCGRLHGPFGEMPSLQSLPARDALLEEVIRFGDAYNPTPHFRKKWGEDYTSSVRSLWERCVQAYKNDVAAPDAVDELLMCFAYDVVLGAARK